MSRRLNDPHERLWLAVVQQALDDLTDEPWHSLHQAQAVAFFTSDGWAARRAEIAEHLGVHTDDLRRVGQERLAARQARDPAPVQPQPVRSPKPVITPPPPRQPLKFPHLVAIPAQPQPQPRPDRGGHKRWTHNPFDPFRRLPSEVRAADAVRLEAAAQRGDSEVFDTHARDAHAPHLQCVSGSTR